MTVPKVNRSTLHVQYIENLSSIHWSYIDHRPAVYNFYTNPKDIGYGTGGNRESTSIYITAPPSHIMAYVYVSISYRLQQRCADATHDVSKTFPAMVGKKKEPHPTRIFVLVGCPSIQTYISIYIYMQSCTRIYTYTLLYAHRHAVMHAYRKSIGNPPGIDRVSIDHRPSIEYLSNIHLVVGMIVPHIPGGHYPPGIHTYRCQGSLILPGINV